MKVITLTQPWATLVAVRAKRIETRSWATAYRGKIAIHASKGFPVWAKDVCFEEPFRSALIAAGLHGLSDLPLGAIIAVGRLTGCYQTGPAESWPPKGSDLDQLLTAQERAFGDYTAGRYAWTLGGVCRLAEPIPSRGALGLWTPPPDVLAQLNAAVLA